jgi:hypothetical protein
LIPEWQRLWERPEFLPESVVCLYLVGVCVWAALVRIRSGPQPPTGTDPQARGVGIRDLAIAFLGFGLAASAVRFLFTLVLPALAATRPLDRVVARYFPVRAGVFAASMIAVIALPLQHLDTVWTGVKAIGVSAYLGPEPPGYPVAAAQFLANSELSGNLAHPARWGGYLAWKLAPRFRTATDGRVTHFGAELAREWSQGIDSPAREEIFARRGVDLVVVPTEMLPSFRNDQPYEVLYRDPQQLAVVLLRTEDGAHSAENVRLLKDAEKQKAIRRALGK